MDKDLQNLTYLKPANAFSGFDSDDNNPKNGKLGFSDSDDAQIRTNAPNYEGPSRAFDTGSIIGM